MSNLEFLKENYYFAVNKFLGAKENVKYANNATQRQSLNELAQRYENQVNNYKEELKSAYMELENNLDDHYRAEYVRALFEGDKKQVLEIANKLINKNFINALSDLNQGGSDLLPKTTSNEIITDVFFKNKLRDHIKITNFSNLEIPKITFSCNDDGFIEGEETAKEIKATGSTVTFGRFKNKLMVNVSETVLLGADKELIEIIKKGLRSGLAKKEIKQLFGINLATNEKHMSFYDGINYTIKSVSAESKYLAIKKAIADLHEDYRENAKVIMSYADYLDIIEALANGNSSLYLAQPEQILGKPAVFVDAATTPIVGDLNYLQINYHPEEIYDADKNVETGINTFVLTCWYDINFLLKSAFRLAEVK